MKRRQKGIIGGALAVVLLLAVSIGVYAMEVGCNKSYALRQLSNVPDSSWVKQETYIFESNSATVTATCTQDTTSGANVAVGFSDGAAAFLNQKGTSYIKTVPVGVQIAVVVTLYTPDNYGTYTGYGTIKN